jgi:hypothetical protein
VPPAPAPGRRWSPEELVAALRGSELIVTQGLASLTAAGLVVAHEDGSVHYQPASPGLDALVTATEAFYAKSPDAVRRMIVASASGGAAAFADAFKLRKE